MPFRFIHTADVHLDSPLRSLAMRDAELASLVSNATRSAFVALIDACIEEQVDALIIAGDLYDGELRSMKTAAFFTGQMQRLVTAGIRAFILRGNHDAESRITRHLTLPEGVHVFSSRGEQILLEDLGVALHGISFAKPHAPESLLDRYKPAVDGLINIGVLHTSLGGAVGHDPYAPCALADLFAFGYTYWALGHIHKRDVHEQDGCTVVMPGIPQGRHINEAGPRSASLVTIDDAHNVTVDEVHTALVQFERMDSLLDECTDWDALLERFQNDLAPILERRAAEHLVIRLTLSGRSPLAGRLRRDRELVQEELGNLARQMGPVVIERIDIEVSMPAETSATVATPVAELRRIVTEGLGADAAMSDIVDLLEQLQRDLPSELADLFPRDQNALEASLRETALVGALDVLARLEAAGDER